MRADIPPYDYRLMTPSGVVLEASTCVGIAEAVRVLAEKTAIQWSYQVVHRAIKLSGVWVGSYRPDQTSSRPVVLVIEQTVGWPDQSPPP